MSRNANSARQTKGDEQAVTLAAAVKEAKGAAAVDMAAVMEDVDALVQHHDDAVQSLIRAAIDCLSPDPDSLVRARHLLLQVGYSSDELMNNVNYLAEQHGRCHVDHAGRAFSDRVHAEARRLREGKAGAA